MPDAGWLALLDQQFAQNRQALRDSIKATADLLSDDPNAPTVALTISNELIERLCIHKVATLAATALIHIVELERGHDRMEKRGMV